MQFSELDLSRECQQVVKAPACSQVCSVPIITLTGCVLSRREEKTGLFCCCYWRPVVLSLCVTISVGRFTSTHHVLWERHSVVDTLLVPLRKIWFWSNTNSEVAWALSVCAGRMLIGILFKVTPKVFWQRGCLWVIHVFGDTNINDAVKVALLPFCEIPCVPQALAVSWAYALGRRHCCGWWWLVLVCFFLCTFTLACSSGPGLQFPSDSPLITVQC